MKSEAEILELVKKYNWTKVIIEEQISEDILRKYNSEFTKDLWSDISHYQKLSEDFIEEFKDKVDWEWISLFQNLSEQFIEKHIDKIDWFSISISQKLSENFIKKYYNKFELNSIFKFQNVSSKFILKHKDKVYRWRAIIFKNEHITQDTIAELWGYLTPHYKRKYLKNLNKVEKLIFLSKVKEKRNENRK